VHWDLEAVLHSRCMCTRILLGCSWDVLVWRSRHIFLECSSFDGLVPFTLMSSHQLLVQDPTHWVASSATSHSCCCRYENF
jgi:hypothetical protein